MIRILAGLLLPLILGQSIPIGSTGPVGPWSLVQSAMNATCTATGTGSSQNETCTITSTQGLSATTAGHTGILLFGSFAGGSSTVPTYSSASGGGTWTHCPAQNASVTNNGQFEFIDCAYILSLSGGATSISVTLNSTSITSGHIWPITATFIEVSKSSGSATYDGCASGSACKATVVGAGSRTSPTCPVSGTDYVVQWIGDTEGITGAPATNYQSPFQNDTTNVASAFAGALNLTSVSALTWPTVTEASTDSAAMATACFK